MTADVDQLQSENDALRAAVEAYRQREVVALREQLAAAMADVAHYRSEADRNAQIGRKIAAESQATIADLRSRLQAREQIPNARPQFVRATV